MIPCTYCQNGFKRWTEGDQEGLEMCPECNGTGQLTFVEWAILNGWNQDGNGGAILDISGAFLVLDQNNELYFSNDFESMHLTTIKTLNQLINNIKAHEL